MEHQAVKAATGRRRAELSLRTLLRAHAATQEEKKKKWEAPPPPTRVGKKQRKKAAEAAQRLPSVTPTSKCKLRLLKLERVKDYLLPEEEYVTNQERSKPLEARNEADRSKVDDLRGTPMSVGSLEELIDDKCAPARRFARLRSAPLQGCRARPRRPRRASRAAHARCSHAIVSSSVGPEYYVSIMSFVDKSQARDRTLRRSPRPPRLTRLRSWSPAAPC